MFVIVKVGYIDLRQDDSVINQAELSSLHYIAGYCIKRVKASNNHCTICLQTVESDQSNQTNISERFTQLKEYKGNGLVYCTDACLSLFEKAENIFRANENSFGNKRNLLGRLVNLANDQTKTITFPSCHDIKSRLISFSSL